MESSSKLPLSIERSVGFRSEAGRRRLLPHGRSFLDIDVGYRLRSRHQMHDANRRLHERYRETQDGHYLPETNANNGNWKEKAAVRFGLTNEMRQLLTDRPVSKVKQVKHAVEAFVSSAHEEKELLKINRYVSEEKIWEW